MKVLGILLLFGLAAIATSFQKRWERERDEAVSLFLKGMEKVVPLRIALGMPGAHELDEDENDIKTELGKTLRKHLDDVLSKIKDAIDHGKEIKQKLLDRAKEIREKLKDLKEGVGEKAKDLLEKLKNRFKDFFKDLLDGLKDKEESALSEVMEADEIDMKEIMNKLKEMIAKHLDLDKIKEYIEKLKDTEIGKILQEKIQKLKDNEALKKLRDFIRKILGKEPRDRRSFQEHWEKVKEYFKDKHDKLKEKYGEFKEWMKEAIRKGLDVAKDKVTSLKNIAKEVIDHSKQISKEVAVEALDALRPYKEDLGDLWKQLKETVNEIVHRKD